MSAVRLRQVHTSREMARGSEPAARNLLDWRAMTGQTQWLDEDQQRCWRAYILGTTLLLDELDRELAEAHGISLNEYEVLVRLSEQPGRQMRMALLAESMAHSRSRITHTVKRMECAGLVERTAAPGDRRGVMAAMTEEGMELLRAAAPTHVDGVRRHLVALASEADFAAIGRVFDTVSDHLLEGAPEGVDIRRCRPD